MNVKTQRVATRAGLTLAAVGLVAASLAGCAPDNGSADGDKEIVVWTWTTPGEELKAAVPGFEEANPGVKVTVEDVGNPAIWDKITTGMAAGGAGLPDVMNIGVDYMSNYLEKFPDGLANLSELGADELSSDFSEAIWASGTDGEGTVYGIPFEEYTSILPYRSDLFEAAGHPYESIETWDDLIEAGVAIKEQTGVQLLAMDKSATVLDSALLWQLLTILQGNFYFDGEGDIALTSDESVRALEIIKEMNDLGLIADVPGDISKIFAAFGEGKIAAIPGATWVPGALPGIVPDLAGKVGLGALPAVTDGGARAALVGGSYLTVSNTSENKELAFEFVKYALADFDAQKAMFEAGGLFPSFRPFQNDPDFVSQPVDFYGGIAPNELIVELLSQSGSERVNYTSDYPAALKLYDDAQTQVLVSGADPEEVLQAAAEQLAAQTGRSIAK